MKHIVVTRLKFDDDELFEKYFSVMKKTYIPSISSQSVKNFKVGLVINEKHKEIVSNEFPDDLELVFFDNLNDDYVNYIKNENIEIQTRHDCDDWMSDDYIEEIQRIYNNNFDKYSSFIIHAQPKKLDFYTGEKFNMGFSYSDNMNSMFLSLCQKECINSVFKEKHAHMFLCGEKVFKMDVGYVELVIHGNNKLSKILDGERKLKDKNKYDLSIIVPTYKNVEFIEECLDSIISSIQKYDCEILVGIDNCNETLSFISENLEKYQDRVNFYFFQPNVGPYIIKNTLAKKCSSDKILFFDSDDIMLDNLVSEVYKNLKNSDCVRFSYNDFRTLEELSEEKMFKLTGRYGEGVFGVKKESFLTLNGFEPWKCAADSEFNWRLGANGKKTTHIPKILFFRRRHPVSLTNNSETGAGSRIRYEYAMNIAMKKKNKKSQPLYQLTQSTYYEINEFGELVNYNDFTNVGSIPVETQKEKQDTVKESILEQVIIKKYEIKNEPIEEPKVINTEITIDDEVETDEPVIQVDIRENILSLLRTKQHHLIEINREEINRKRTNLNNGSSDYSIIKKTRLSEDTQKKGIKYKK